MRISFATAPKILMKLVDGSQPIRLTEHYKCVTQAELSIKPILFV
jgi:hypothetical protein